MTTGKAPLAGPDRTPPPQPSNPVKSNTLRRILRPAWAGFILILTGPVWAQPASEPAPAASARGEVAGVVMDQFSGTTLVGARVWVDGTLLQVLSDEFGRFRIPNIPVGPQRLFAAYAGLVTAFEEIEVSHDQPGSVIFSLASEVIELEEFVVYSEREGNAGAIQAQRNAPNVMNILALDALGILPNDNAGELLARMPGVAPRLDEEGGVTGVSIRGFQPGDNSVTVDGDKMSSSGGLNRDFRMNSISGALFDEIEVTKAPTPEMDAESLGGAVNFRSRSPLSLRGNHRIDYRVSAKWAASFVDRTPMSEQHPWHPLINLSYQGVYDLFGGTRNFGIATRLFFSENANSAFTSQRLYAYATSTAALPDRAIVNGPFYWENTYPYEIRFRDLYNNRKQASLNIRTEYKISDDTRIWVTAIANNAIESGQHIYQERYFFSSQTETYNPDGTIANYGTRLDGTPFSPDYVSLRSGARHQINSTVNTFDQYDRRLQLAGEHRAGNLKFYGRLNYSRTKVVMDDTPHSGTGVAYTELKSAGSTNLGIGHAYTFDGRFNPVLPTITQTLGSDFTDIDNYGGSAGSTVGNLNTRMHYRSRENRRDTTIFSGAGDASYVLNTRIPTIIKTGISLREQEIDTPFNARDYYYLSDEVAKFQEQGVETFWGRHSGMQSPFLSVPLVTKDILENPGDWGENLDYFYQQRYGNTKNVKEKVTSAYVQGTAIFHYVQALGGVRVEHTSVDGYGFLTDPAAPDLSYTTDLAALEAKYNNPAHNRGSYTNVFPGLHLKFEPADRFILRASFSTSIGRPNLSDVAPGLSLGTSTDGEYSTFITINNPDLKAQYSRNYDLTAEYYFRPYGVVSAGYFHKDIKDFIYREDSGDAGTILGPAFDGVRLRRMLNGGKAKVDGVEFGYQHQLRALPGILKGLNLYGNFTYLKTRGDYDNGESSEVARFVPRSANGGFRFRHRAFTLDMSVNHVGDHLDIYQSDPSRRIYRKARTLTNASVSYRFHRRLMVFANVNNLFNEPQEFYQKGADGERFNRHVYNATTMVFGVSGRY